MEKQLSKTAQNLIEVLNGRVDEHTCVGIFLRLSGVGDPLQKSMAEKDKNFQKMIDFIEHNSNADQSAIMLQHRAILGLAPYPTRSRFAMA